MTLLNQGIRRLISPLSSLFSTGFLKAASGVSYIAPFYHTVSNAFIPHLNTLYQTRSESQFKADLKCLAKHFKFVDPIEFRDAIQHGNAKGMALLSFDDGLVQCFEVVRPVLLELGIPAIFFINPNFIGGKRVFYRYKVGQILYEVSTRNDSSLEGEIIHKLNRWNKFNGHLGNALMSLKWEDEALINECFSLLQLTNWEQNIYMNSDQLSKMLDQGFYFGGHGMDHRPFFGMSARERDEDVGKSLLYCSEELNQKIRLFAFPFFDYNLSAEFIDHLHSEMAIDLSFGSSGLKVDEHVQNIQRLDMETNMTSSVEFIKYSLGLQAVRRLAGSSKLKRG